jgi:hypothetical protein
LDAVLVRRNGVTDVDSDRRRVLKAVAAGGLGAGLASMGLASPAAAEPPRRGLLVAILLYDGCSSSL